LHQHPPEPVGVFAVDAVRLVLFEWDRVGNPFGRA
jgi:hypothetical protein